MKETPTHSGALLVTFAGGNVGSWEVERITAIRGEELPKVERLAVIEGEASRGLDAVWTLRGVTGPDHYVTELERQALIQRQESLGRPGSSFAAMIPIRKSATWWGLPQRERRAIFEERSHHVAGTLAYLPRIARRLHHGRALGEPFDFVTWFEFAPADKAAFDELVAMLRATEEWNYVEREVDVRLSRLRQ